MFRSGSTICCPDWGTDGLLRIRRIGGRPEVAPQVSSRLIETVRARERAGHQHVGAGRLRNDCWRCGANQNNLPRAGRQDSGDSDISSDAQDSSKASSWLLPRSAAHCAAPAARTAHLGNAAYCRSTASQFTYSNSPNSDSQSRSIFASNRSETITAPGLENTLEWYRERHMIIRASAPRDSRRQISGGRLYRIPN